MMMSTFFLLLLIAYAIVANAQRHLAGGEENQVLLNNIDEVTWRGDARAESLPPIEKYGKPGYDDQIIKRKLTAHMGSPKSKKLKSLLVTCKDDQDEEDCKQALEVAGASIVHAIPNTPFFGIKISDEAGESLKNLPQVELVEDDPIRTLSRINKPGDQSHRSLQRRQRTSYGVDMVRAPEVWNAYGNKGENAKVCIIDTGIHENHEDFVPSNLSGSTSISVDGAWVSTDRLLFGFFFWMFVSHRLLFLFFISV
jgi:subtilisin family serine protease